MLKFPKYAFAAEALHTLPGFLILQVSFSKWHFQPREAAFLGTPGTLVMLMLFPHFNRCFLILSAPPVSLFLLNLFE